MLLRNTIPKSKMVALLRINYWPIRKSLLIVFSLLLSLLGFIAFDFIRLEIPIFRELAGFLFLTFVPGFLMLRILRIHNLSSIGSVIYSVGASLSLIMLSGLFMDLVYPIFGIEKPFSIHPLIITLAVLTMVLCIVCYVRDKDFNLSADLKDIARQFSPSVLSLLLIPFLSIFGAYVMNVYNNNTLILLFLLVVSLIPVLIVFNKIPPKLHGFAIYIVSISILYHVSLISWYLWGWDIHLHFYWSNLVRQNLYWDPSDYPLLLTTILPTVYSVVTGLSLVWVYKIFFPFFVSLIPLGIYSVCREELGDELISALAPFPFMFYYWFYKTFPVKQLPSELFLVLLVMLTVDKKIPNFGKIFLAILFSFALVVSHYGVSYFFMLILIFAATLQIFRLRMESEITKPTFVMLFTLLATSWYMFVSKGDRFEGIARLGYNIITNLAEILSSPPARSGLAYATMTAPSLTWAIYKYLNYLLILFITLGIVQLLVSLIKRRKICNTDSFAALSIGSYAFLFSSIVITYGMGFDRTLQITLVLLAPSAVIGCKLIFDFLLNTIKRLKLLQSKTMIDANLNLSIKVFGVFLAIFFLFSSGFMFQVASENTPPYCIAIDMDNWVPWHTYYQSEVKGVKWLEKYSLSDKIATLNVNPKKNPGLLTEFYQEEQIFAFDARTSSIPSGIPIYLDKSVTKERRIPFKLGKKIKYLGLEESTFYKDILMRSNKIYDSGRSWVFIPSKRIFKLFAGGMSNEV